MGCKKRTYPSEIDAKLALAETKRKRRPREKEEDRYYKCSRCWGWHLTSAPYNPKKKGG